MQTTVIFILYRAALIAAFPLLLLYVLWRVARNGRYRRLLGERFGIWRPKARTAPGSVWLHAVSVGEVLAAEELLRRLRKELPHTPLYISCSTLGGRDAAEGKLAKIVDGVFFAPYDLVFAVRGALRAIRPSVLVVLETEIWPNLYRETKRAGAAVLIVNGRISDKAVRNYVRFNWFFRAAFAFVDRILTQSLEDQRRFVAAGADPDRVRAGGNLKYDFEVRQNDAPAIVVNALRHPLWIAASTSGPMGEDDVDEDDAVLAAHAELLREQPALQLLLAPRKPERFDAVADKLARTGLVYARRSQMSASAAPPQVILLDTVGELGSLFPFADVVFMGGTLAERGGHNILEPALCGKPVIAGPHLENFTAIRDRFAAASGYVAIGNAADLLVAVGGLLRDAGLRGSLGARAKALAQAERGATARALRLIASERWEFVPRSIGWGIARPVLGTLAALWTAGGSAKRTLRKPRRLSTRVISVGGLAMGGVGKTPMVCYLADVLRARGYRPAILTRGYKRRSREIACLPKGSDAPIDVTGDEAQLLLQHAHVGIGGDRWAVGRQMEKRFQPDVFLLDDGFQHSGLHRDVDILLLDGMDPFGGDAVFPTGKLREPVSASERADLVVISRVGKRRFDGVIRRLPKVPVFLADVEISGWFPEQPRLDGVAAFCGLANPQTFFDTLTQAGADVLVATEFRDHHRYTSEDVRSLAEAAMGCGAKALVTTEKDWVNLPSDAAVLASPLPIACVAVRTRLGNESEFATEVESMLGISARYNDGRVGR